MNGVLPCFMMFGIPGFPVILRNIFGSQTESSQAVIGKFLSKIHQITASKNFLHNLPVHKKSLFIIWVGIYHLS